MDDNILYSSTDEQISNLKKRGLIISDEDKAKNTLSNISFFHLKTFFYYFEKNTTTHRFKRNTTFEDVINLYRFDCELSNLIFQAVKDIEISLKSLIIQNFSQGRSPLWYLDENLFNKNFFNKKQIEEELLRSNEDFVKEYVKYKKDKKVIVSYPPIWKMMEVLSFGIVSKFLSNFRDNKSKVEIVRYLGLKSNRVLKSWSLCLSNLRNFCSHHYSLWDREFPHVPVMPQTLPNLWLKNINVTQNHKIYPYLCCIIYLLSVINPDNSFKIKLLNLLKSNKKVKPSLMGFPKGWKKEKFWKIK